MASPITGPYGVVPELVKSIVAPIFLPDRDGVPLPAGTGFILQTRGTTDPQQNYRFLVTAKHLVIQSDGTRYPEIWVRLQTRSGADLISLANEPVWIAEDPSVDLALLPGAFDADVYVYRALDAEGFLASRSDLFRPRFGEGSPVFYVGLFTPHAGAQRNQPVVRFGRVALVPSEPVIWDTDDVVDVVLVEIGAYAGSSGSPVFVFRGDTDERGLPLPKLLGVLKGAFTQTHVAKLIEVEANLSVRNIVGIAAVTPAYLLNALLRAKAIPAAEAQ